jgi:hypothetical protein
MMLPARRLPLAADPAEKARGKMPANGGRDGLTDERPQPLAPLETEPESCHDCARTNVRGCSPLAAAEPSVNACGAEDVARASRFNLGGG